jgi:hypothetical protein
MDRREKELLALLESLKKERQTAEEVSTPPPSILM